MNFDFDSGILRTGTSCLKYDGRKAYFGNGEVVPLWVADMDFAAPEAVTQALMQRASHPVYGYTLHPESMFDALISWMRRRHGWDIQREWIVMCPGVVPSLHAAVLAFTQPGDAVIVQPPVYAPFFSAVQTIGRRLVQNPLRLENGRYTMDFDHLDQCAAAGARLLLLCSPHNPVGRVWNGQELAEVLNIARRYGLIVLSDEIHADLVYPGNQHAVLAALTESGDKVITAVAPSKTFNIPGLALSALVVPNPEQRAAIIKAFDLLHVGTFNPFSMVAFEAAYDKGEPWLAGLLDYLSGTRDLVRSFLAEHLPGIHMIEPEGTYLLWLDCRELEMEDGRLKNFFIQQATVGLNPGSLFGAGGSGFMRMNIGAPRQTISNALNLIWRAYQTYFWRP